jgi:hypothetical protein
MASATATKHSCNGPHFGQLAPAGDCKRCDELRSGSPARQAPHFARAAARRAADARGIAAHFAPNGPHARGVCGPVCTFGDW